MMWLAFLIILSSLILAIASCLDRWFRRDPLWQDWTWRASLAAMILMVPLGWLRPWSAQVTCYLPLPSANVFGERSRPSEATNSSPNNSRPQEVSKVGSFDSPDKDLPDKDAMGGLPSIGRERQEAEYLPPSNASHQPQGSLDTLNGRGSKRGRAELGLVSKMPSQETDGTADKTTFGRGSSDDATTTEPRSQPAAAGSGFSWLYWICLIFSVGAVYRLILMLLSLYWLHRIARQGTRVATGAWSQAVALIGREGHKTFDLRAFAAIESPMIAGWIQPIILIPQRMQSWSDPAVCRQVLLHEVAHLNRLDHWTNLLLQVAGIGLWFHPGYYWMRRRICFLREVLCDASVVSEFGSISYAETLFSLAHPQPASHRSKGIALAIAATPSQLRKRIEFMFDDASGVRLSPIPSRLRAIGWGLFMLMAVPVALLNPVARPSGIGSIDPARLEFDRASKPDEANLVPSIQDEPPSDVSQALRSLQAIDSFRHIDLELAVKVEDCKRFGPELNALLTIRNEQRSPVAGALVAVVESARDRFGWLGPSFIDHPMDILPIAMAVTDRDGRVAFEHVHRSHNHYDVESSVPRAYLLVLHPDYAWRLHRLDHHDGPQEADITLATPRTLRGKLTAEGKPVEGAVVSISEYWFHKARLVDPALAELWECPLLPIARSDAGGEFRFDNMPEGWADFSIKHPLYDEDHSTSRNSFFRLAESLNFDLVKKTRHPIAVRLLDDQSGQPIGDLTLLRRLGPVRVDAQGHAELNDVMRWGENGVSYSIAPPLPYAGKSIRTISTPDAERFDVRLRQGVIVRGRVEDEVSKLGIPGLKLTATLLPEASNDESPNDKSQNPKPLLNVSQSSIADNAFATTDAKGDFAIALPIGKVRLSLVSRVSGYEFVPNSDDRSDGQARASKQEPWNVVIDTSDPARIDSQSLFPSAVFRLKKVTPIHGRVIDERGKAVAGAKIQVEGTMLGWNSMATSASDGTFSVVPPFGASEKVTVSVLHNENASRQQVELDASGSYRGGPLMLELNSESSRYTIGGSVFSNGIGSEGVLVAAYAIKDTGGSFQIGPENTIGWAWTNADGRYFMEVATPSISQITMHILGPESFQMGTLPIIQLKPGHNEIDSVEFADQHGKRTLRGEIMDLNGDPVAGARIMAIVEQSKTQLLRQEEAKEKQDTSGTSDADGKFECKNLSLGKLRLQIHAKDFGDPWASAMNTIVQNVNVDRPLVAILDPRLAIPPTLVEPTTTRDAPELEPNPAVWQQAQGPVIRGKVVGDQQKPVANATIQVFATKPLLDPVTTLPLSHPWNGMTVKTNDAGEYTLQLPDSGYQVRLLAIGQGLTGQLSPYLDPSQESQWNATLQVRPEIDPKAPFQTQVLDGEKRPMANALVFSLRSFDQIGLADEVGIGAPAIIRWTDEKGFAGPGIDASDLWKLIHQRGMGLRYLSPNGYGNDLVDRGFSIVGRLVDDQNVPVANYAVCASATSRKLTHRVVTDAQGYFRMDDIAFLGANFGTEFFLYGDIRARDPRGWLETRRITIPTPGKLLELPPLQLRKNQAMRIHLVDPTGNPVEASLQCEFQLRQASLGLSMTKLESGILIEHLPSEPIRFTPRVTGYRILHTEPAMQSIGWEPFTSFGMLLEEDCDVTLTVVP